MPRQRSFALTIALMAALSGRAAIPSSPNDVPLPLGVVLLGEHADGHIETKLSGATIYDGDRLETESSGALRARLRGSRVYLGPSAAVDLHEILGGFSADLISGTIVLSSSAGQSFRLLANGAIIRPATQQAAVLRLTKVSSYELLLTANRGAVQVSLDDEVRIVEAGNSYRIVIHPVESSRDNTSGNPPQDKGGHPPEGPPTGPPAHPTARNRVTWIAIPVIASATGIVLWRALVSPTAP